MNEAKGLAPMQQCHHGRPLQWCEACLWPLVQAADGLLHVAEALRARRDAPWLWNDLDGVLADYKRLRG